MVKIMGAREIQFLFYHREIKKEPSNKTNFIHSKALLNLVNDVQFCSLLKKQVAFNSNKSKLSL